MPLNNIICPCCGRHFYCINVVIDEGSEYFTLMCGSCCSDVKVYFTITKIEEDKQNAK